jgi:hypothetical protein
MRLPCSSGSRRVDRALDPTTLQNMIVIWRRSAEDVAVVTPDEAVAL